MTSEMMAKFKGVPDVYFALRVRNLVDKGLVESTGNLDYMRYSEVRLRRGGEV